MLRALILRSAFTLQLQRLMRRFHRDRLVVLMYHGFREASDRPGLSDPDGNHVCIDSFARQVEYLARRHSIVSLHDVISARETGIPLPPYPVVITMDDGYRSNYLLAFPILQRLRARASIFLTTSFVDEGIPLWPDRLSWAIGTLPQALVEIDIAGETTPCDLRTEMSRMTAVRALTARLKEVPQDAIESVLDGLERRAGGALRAGAASPWCEPLRWDEIRTMQASGLIELGNHTWRHLILARCAPQEERDEIESAHRTIESRLGVATDLFCYPNGTPGDYDEDTKATLRELGYRCSPPTIPGINVPSTDLFELRRAAVNDRASFDDFLTTLYGGVRQLAADLTHPPVPSTR